MKKVVTFTKLYLDKYIKDNIRMNNMLPLFIDCLTLKNEFLKHIHLGNYGEISKISALIEILASEGGVCITSQNIMVDDDITRSV